MGFVGNPDLLSLPPSKVLVLARCQGLLTWQQRFPFGATGRLPRAQEAPERAKAYPCWPCHESSRGWGSLSLNWTAVDLAMQPADTRTNGPPPSFVHFSAATSVILRNSVKRQAHHWWDSNTFAQWTRQHCHAHSMSLCYAL